jgi:RNA polymerase sigma-70 factor, ECF subfamily
MVVSQRKDERMLAPQDDVVSLVRLAKAGDQEAFADLVLLYENELCGYLAMLLRDRDEALNCAQQAFFKAWGKLTTLKDETSFKPWLYIIARNVAWDYLRGRKKIPLESWEDLEEYSIVDTMSQIEERATLAELINLALAELPPKLRACLRLDAWGCSRCEIAQIIGISPNSVSTYMSTARKQFRQIYTRLEQA